VEKKGEKKSGKLANHFRGFMALQRRIIHAQEQGARPSVVPFVYFLCDSILAVCKSGGQRDYVMWLVQTKKVNSSHLVGFPSAKDDNNRDNTLSSISRVL
jgi:hypothetical protein